MMSIDVVEVVIWRESSFYFRAEDGIRYWSVTGVQTCALPISVKPCSTTAAKVKNPSPAMNISAAPSTSLRLTPGARCRASVDGIARRLGLAVDGEQARSEERRVGKARRKQVEQDACHKIRRR